MNRDPQHPSTAPIVVDTSYQALVSPARPRREDETPQGAPDDTLLGRLGDLRLGEWLVHRGLISSSDLFTALEQAYLNASRIGDALVDRGLLARRLVEEEARAHSTFVRHQPA